MCQHETLELLLLGLQYKQVGLLDFSELNQPVWSFVTSSTCPPVSLLFENRKCHNPSLTNLEITEAAGTVIHTCLSCLKEEKPFPPWNMEGWGFSLFKVL